MLLQHYTNPMDVSQVDAAILAGATATIDFAAYSLTHPTIIATLIKAAQDGVKVRLYLDRTELEALARGNPTLSNTPLAGLIAAPNVLTKVKESTILMHLKSYLVDGKLLRDGSANFSPLGEGEQDNSMFLTDDGPTVELFASKFAAMWNRPDNLGVAQAVQSAHNQGHAHPHSH